MILRVTTFLALLILAIEAKKYSPEQEKLWQEFEEFIKWKKSKELGISGPQEIKYEEKPVTLNEQNPPPVSDAALMARYVVNQADWASIATISTRKDIPSYPVTNLISISDGELGKGLGVPYMYLTPRDYTAQDLAKDSRATLLMSLAQGDYCKEKEFDPMDPRCARVIMTGRIKALKNDTMEHEIAKTVFFQRHPKLVNMPANHHFYFAKLKIMSIALLDNFGGPKYISVKDYFHPSMERATESFLQRLASGEIENLNFENPIVNRV